MDKRSLDGKQSSKEVTEVISRNIMAGHERDYDDWLRRFMISERQFPGYLGTTIIVPGGNVSSVRLHYQSLRQSGVAGCVGKFRRITQTIRRSEQILYSPESYWYGDVV